MVESWFYKLLGTGPGTVVGVAKCLLNPQAPRGGPASGQPHLRGPLQVKPTEMKWVVYLGVGAQGSLQQLRASLEPAESAMSNCLVSPAARKAGLVSPQLPACSLVPLFRYSR